MVHVWIYFLLKANYQDGKWHGIDVPRGSLITSIDTICKDTGLSRQSVRTCISKLKSTHEITITSTHKYSVINICKYDKYNINIDFTNTQPNTQPNQQITQFQHSANTVPTLLKEDNKDNNNNKETKEEELTNVSKKKDASGNNTDNKDAEFIERMYKLYPTKCPKRNMSLGKSSRDKDRIAKLLKKYTKEQIEFVINREIEEKFGKHYMQNFSTFLNNFPEPEITDANGYCPVVDGIFTTWDDEEKCVRLSNNNIDGFCDGYSKKNRPDGATVKYGMYTWKWSSGKVKWVRQ